jgi:hypothetical protein
MSSSWEEEKSLIRQASGLITQSIKISREAGQKLKNIHPATGNALNKWTSESSEAMGHARFYW